MSKMNPDKGLVRSGFMECVVRCAKDKFFYYKSMNLDGEITVTKSMKKLYRDHIIPYCQKLDYNVIFKIDYFTFSNGERIIFELKKLIAYIKFLNMQCSNYIK